MASASSPKSPKSSKSPRNWEQEKKQLVQETGLDAERVQEFKEIFGLVDIDGGGAISPDELMSLTELLNMGVTKQEVERMVEQIDKTGSGEVQFRDFLVALSNIPEVDYTDRDVIRAFQRLAGPRWGPDPQLHGPEKGSISIPALEHALMHIGEGMTEEDARELSNKAEDGVVGGMLDYTQYVRIMMADKR